MAARASATKTCGTSSSNSRSTTNPMAPASTAAAAQRPQLDLATVIGKPLNLDGRVPSDPGSPSFRDKLFQSHAGDSRQEVGGPSYAAAACFSPQDRPRPPTPPKKKPTTRGGPPPPPAPYCGGTPR